MSIKVTIKPNRSSVSSVNIGPKPNISLGQITNVDATSPDNGEILVYDANTNSYTVKTIPFIAGGSF